MNTIIFLHGNACSSKIMDPVINKWKKDTRIISIDLPGHGMAEKTGNYSWNSNKSYLLEKINKIEGYKLLLGNSLGGFYIVELAQMVHALKGLVVINSSLLKNPLNFEEAFAPNPYTEIYLKESPSEEELDYAASAVVKNKSIIPILKDDFYRTDTKARRAIIDWLAKPDEFLDQAEIFSTLQLPKYIINGTDDPIINFDYLKKLQKEAVYPFELLEINNCGHYPPLERPEEFTKILSIIHDEVFQ